MNDGQDGGIHIASVGRDLSFQAYGDIVGGDKTTINNYIQNIIQRTAQALTNTPYKFLASYDITDHDIFHGRDAAIAELEALVGRHKVILVNGASGSGKTSLVNAGLIPRVTDNGYTFVAIREYSDPLAQLQAYFDSAQSPPTSQASVRAVEGEGSLSSLIRGHGTFPMVVILDQFERFFVRVDAKKRCAFLADFSHCLRHTDAPQLCFVLAFRREFLGQLMTEAEEQYPEFNTFPRINLLPLRRAEAREAIVRPVDPVKTGLPILYDDDFVDKVLLAGLAEQTSGGESIDPPHLQIVCNQLFEVARVHLKPGRTVLINRALYDELGGARQILSTYLDTVVEKVALDPEGVGVVRSILKTMVDVGSNTRAFVAKDGLGRALPDVDEAEILKLLEKLLESRVVEERKPEFSLSHEHMVAKVKDWFDPRELERKRAEETLHRGMMEWSNSRAVLNRGQVERIRKWLPAPDQEARELLQASEENYVKEERKEADRKKLKKMSLYGAAAFVVLVFILGAISFVQMMRAQLQEKIALSRQYAAEANSLLDGNLDDALLLSARALAVQQTTEARNALFRAMSYNPALVAFLYQLRGGEQPAAAFSPDGNQAVLAAGNVFLVLGLTSRIAPTSRPINWSYRTITAIAYSHGGSYLAVGGRDGRISLLSTSNWDVVGSSVEVSNQAIDRVFFSVADNGLIAVSGTHWIRLSASDRGLTTIRNGQIRDPAIRDGSFVTANTSDGRILVTAIGRTVTLWRMDDELEQYQSFEVGHQFTVAIREVAISPDGKRVAVDLVAGSDGIGANFIHLYSIEDATTPRQIRSIQTPKWVLSDAPRMAFSNAGDQLFVGNPDGTFEFVDLKRQPRTAAVPAADQNSYSTRVKVRGATGALRYPQFSRDDQSLVFAIGPRIVLWGQSPSSTLLRQLFEFRGKAESVAFTNNGGMLVLTTSGGMVEHRSTRDGSLQLQMPASGNPTTGIASSFTSKNVDRLVISDNNQTPVIDATNLPRLRHARTENWKVLGESPDLKSIAVFQAGVLRLLRGPDLAEAWRIQLYNAQQLLNPPLSDPGVTFYQNGNRILVHVYGTTVIDELDGTSGRPVDRFEAGARREWTWDAGSDPVVSPDGAWIITNASSVSSRAINTATRKAHELRGFPGSVCGVALSADSTTVALAYKRDSESVSDSPDGVARPAAYGVRFWDLAAQRWREDAITGLSGPACHLSFSPDGEQLALVVSDEDGPSSQVLLWDFAPKRWVTSAAARVLYRGARSDPRDF